MQIGSAAFIVPLSSSPAARPPSSATSPAESSDRAVDPSRNAERGVAGESPREAEQQRQHRLEIADLASRDREVRAHEQAHAAVGGAHAGAPTYTIKRGPDGKNYLVGGEVSIDTGPVPNDPEATLRKMELVQRAALAPAEPSAQDRRVAAQASAQAAVARAELARQRRDEEAAVAEARAERRAQRQAEEEQHGGAEDQGPRQPASAPPGLELDLRLAGLQAPVPAVDLRV